MRGRGTDANPGNLKQTVFAVPMKCGDCVKHVSDTLYGIGGISKVDANLKDQLVFVEGIGMKTRAPMSKGQSG